MCLPQQAQHAARWNSTQRVLHMKTPLPHVNPLSHKIYIAGPMTGLPELNFPAFHAEAARLRAFGYEVINPAEINPDKHMT